MSIIEKLNASLTSPGAESGKRADSAHVLDAEARLGFSLPPLLKAIYTKVGNGATSFFGGRLIGVGNGVRIYDADIVDRYFIERDAEAEEEDEEEIAFSYEFKGRIVESWPEKLVPFCVWPGDLYACTDCSEAAFPIYLFDASCLNPYKPSVPVPLPLCKPTFEAWVEYGIDNEDTFWDEMRDTVKAAVLQRQSASHKKSWMKK